LKIPTDMVKELREQSGAGIMECRNTLLETEGNIDKALQILKERNLIKAEKKSKQVDQCHQQGTFHQLDRSGLYENLVGLVDQIGQEENVEEGYDVIPYKPMPGEPIHV